MILFNKHIKYTLINLLVYFTVSFNLVYASDGVSKNQSIISLSGQHTIMLKHDQVTISGSVITYSLNAQQAVEANAVVLKKIRTNLKKANIDPDTLYSINYTVKSNYDYNEGKQTFRNYQVSHDLSISTKKLDKVGIVADLLTNSGMNQINNIDFSNSEIDQAYKTALKKAIEDAKDKAEFAVSGIDNVSIGKVLSIHVNPPQHSSPPVFYQEMAEHKMSLASAEPTKIHTEGEKLTVIVQTNWEILHSK